MIDWDNVLPHLQELRSRLFKCLAVFILTFVIGYAISDVLFQALVKPLASAYLEHGDVRRLIYTGVTEVFTTYVRTGAFFALCITLPYVALQIWYFIAPGLYGHEQRFFRVFVALTPLLFFMGAFFAYSWVLPVACRFFISFEMPAALGAMAIEMEPRVHEYLSFVVNLMLAFGLCFQLPVLLIILVRSGLVARESIIKQWRVSVAIITAMAAILTPPDLVSMLALIVPLLLLYGLSIGCLYCLGNLKEKKL